MGYSFTRADVEFLRSEAGEAALAAAAEADLTPTTMLSDVTTLRSRYAPHDAAVVETVLCRRRGRAKLRAADAMLFTDDALQQATPTAVAAHRAAEIAARYPGAVVHDVTCSIGAEIVELAARPDLAGVIGSDLDRIRLSMAQHNCAVTGRTATCVAADAMKPASDADVFVADPARRSGAGRIFRPEQLTPPLPEVLNAYAGRPLAVKCAPGLDYRDLRDRFGFTGQVQITSLDGAVREACLWTARADGPERRATVLRTRPDGSVRSYEVTSDDDGDVAAGEIGDWIVDPDGASVRAGLVRNYARRHGLWQIDPRIAYLTGDSVPAGERGFRVIGTTGVSEKELRRTLTTHDCGRLEILVRGLDIDPDRLRTRLKLRGTRGLALVLTRIGRKGVGIVCEPGVIAR